MTDDIAALIDEARRLIKDPTVDVALSPFLMGVASALSGLTAPPPDEIAGLIRQIDKEMAGVEPAFAERRGALLLEAAAALRALAQENERSNSQNEIVCEQLAQAMERITALEHVISELEAERERLLARASYSDDTGF